MSHRAGALGLSTGQGERKKVSHICCLGQFPSLLKTTLKKSNKNCHKASELQPGLPVTEPLTEL